MFENLSNTKYIEILKHLNCKTKPNGITGRLIFLAMENYTWHV